MPLHAAPVVDPGHVRRVYLASIKVLRDSLCEPKESVEWRSLPIQMRCVVVLMAGMDDQFSSKNFAEFTPPEKHQIKLQLRAMKRQLAPLMALTGW